MVDSEMEFQYCKRLQKEIPIYIQIAIVYKCICILSQGSQWVCVLWTVLEHWSSCWK